MATIEKDVETTHRETHHAEQDLAAIANQEDHETGKWQTIVKQPWAFAWCLYAVWTVLLVSFENQASGNVLSIPQFRKDFGHYFDGNYVLESKWQSAFNGAPVASTVVGALFCGQLADSIGRRNTIICALALSFGAVTMEFVATSNELFFGGKFLNGFAVGTIQACAGTYIGEIVPLALRGLMTCLIALSYTVGPFTVALIVNSTGTYGNRWAYRAVFCSQYGFAAVAAIFVWFMPESPWCMLAHSLVETCQNADVQFCLGLATKGREDEALRSLQKLGYSASIGDDVSSLLRGRSFKRANLDLAHVGESTIPHQCHTR